MATHMKGPYVNINGTAREELIKQAFDVSGAAEALIQALGRAAPHGRDYQTAMTGAPYQHDRLVWEGYLNTVRDIYNEYRGIGERLHMERQR